MQLKRIKIGSVETPNNVFLAPLAGYTDFAFRNLCCRLGAGLTFTEMVSCKGLVYNNERTNDLLICGKDEKIKAVQIFGCDPEIMSQAIKNSLMNFDIIDINMGCPVPKLYKNGEGSALLNNIPLASKVISSCSSTGKNITVKFRIGTDKNNKIGVEFAKMCEDSGAKMITVHGRTREMFYSGEVDFEEIARIKQAVHIPVIANGGIFSNDDANDLMKKSGADGVMIARGALYNPLIFSEITNTKNNKGKLQLYCEQIDDMLSVFPDEYVARNLRKLIAFYVKGERNGKQLKLKIFAAKTTDEIKKALSDIFS